jgi:hypothetical protein
MAIDANDALVPAAAGEAQRDTAPIFFAVSISKFIVLSICSIGIYDLYWFYKNWQLVRAREQSDILPFWRAFFGIFFCYAMFKEVRDYDLQTGSTKELPAGALAIGWIVTNLLWRLPDPYCLICALSFSFVIPIQIVANRVNEVVAPGHDRNSRYTAANWTTVAVGGVVQVLIVLGVFLSPEQ